MNIMPTRIYLREVSMNPPMNTTPVFANSVKEVNFHSKLTQTDRKRQKLYQLLAEQIWNPERFVRMRHKSETALDV